MNPWNELSLPTFGEKAGPMTRADFSSLENNCEWLGTSRLLMMENAGASISRAASALLKDVSGKKIAIFSGRGNNGGDGLVAARHLAALGARVKAFIAGGKPVSKQALYNYKILKKCPLSVELTTVEEKEDVPDRLEVDLIIDALLGTGIRGAPRGVIVNLIRLINSSDAPVISVDTPSGLNPFTGESPGEVVKADVTVTFHAPKPGLLSELCGRTIVEQVGAPVECLTVAGPGDAGIVIERRPKWSHKGDFGAILIVGGSRQYSGAPAFAALAALRTGADLTTVIAPRSAAMPVKSIWPDVISVPLESDDFLSPEDVPHILKIVEKSDVVVVGPGLGRTEKTERALTSLFEALRRGDSKVIADADALKTLRPGMGWRNLIITPHSGEFESIFTLRPSIDLFERIEAAVRASDSLPGTILLKGHVDVIAGLSGWKINTSGNPAMTVGGTGDVLSGVTAALFALHEDPVRAASSAAYITGRAGDITYSRLSYSLTASDVISCIPEVLGEVLS